MNTSAVRERLIAGPILAARGKGVERVLFWSSLFVARLDAVIHTIIQSRYSRMKSRRTGCTLYAVSVFAWVFDRGG